MNEMRKEKTGLALKLLITAFAAALIIMFFLKGTAGMSVQNQEKGRQSLENAIRRTAAACYAQEGVYPPDMEYLEDYYGIQVNRDLYTVHYEVVASNLVPEITVLCR